ncbi:heme-thiolate peroxidase [Nemania bipapillata]|uniref:Heme-thiolate peroxidase n=1 Tax=Nemania bipapillata TaxID=110536 RepID=A0ACC2I746_9PEZI|nr:heme-thiolate peroxidase [Nemania bipapillata]
MRFPLLASSLTIGLACGQTQPLSIPGHPWIPAGSGDFRGPCPMMNTLANHGFIQHDGRNMTRENVIKGLGEGLNFDPALASVMFDQAIIANPEPNATYFTLDQLNKHNLLEHDASLSRSDAYFGNNHVFNQTVFDQTKSYWQGPVIDINMLANSKVARQLTSKAFNPTYVFTLLTEEFSLGEVIAPIIAFGDTDNLTVNRSLVEYFFENERLPSELGWKVRSDVVALQDVARMTGALRNATKLTTDSATTVSKRALGRNPHFGFVTGVSKLLTILAYYGQVESDIDES